MKNKGTVLAVSLILLQSLLYGFGDPISKQAYGVVSVFSLLTVRYSIAALCLILIFGKRVWSTLRSCNWKPLILPSLCLAGSFVVSNVAIMTTSPTSVAFLRSTAVIITPLLSLIVLRTRYSLKHLPVLAAVMFGLYLLCSPGGSFKLGFGEILSLISAFMAAGSLVFAEEALEKIDAITVTTFQTVTSALMAGICALIFEGGVHVSQASTSVWLTIVYLGIGCTLAGYLLQNNALKHISSNSAAMLQTTYPVMTGVFSFFILKERIGAAGITGAIIIIACVIAENLIMTKGPGSHNRDKGMELPVIAEI